MITPREWFEDCPAKELRRLLELYRPTGNQARIDKVIESARTLFSDPAKQSTSIDKLLTLSWEGTLEVDPGFRRRKVLLPDQLNDAISFYACMRDVPRKEAEARLIAKRIFRNLKRTNEIDVWLQQKHSRWHTPDAEGTLVKDKPGYKAVFIELPQQLDDLVVEHAQNIGIRPNTLIRTFLNLGLAEQGLTSGWIAPYLPELRLVTHPSPGAAFRLFRGESVEDIARLVIRAQDAAAAFPKAEPRMAEAIGPLLKDLQQRVSVLAEPRSQEVDLSDLSLPDGVRIEPLNLKPFVDLLEEVGREGAFIGIRRWLRGVDAEMHFVVDPQSQLLRDFYTAQPKHWARKVRLSVPAQSSPEFLKTLSQELAGVVIRNPMLCNPPDPLDIFEGAASGAAVATLVAMGFEAVLSFGPRDNRDPNEVDYGSVEVRMSSGDPALDTAVVRALRKLNGLPLSGEESNDELD